MRLSAMWWLTASRPHRVLSALSLCLSSPSQTRKEGCRWNSPLCIAVGRTTPGVERLPDGAPTRHYRLPYPTTGSKSTVRRNQEAPGHGQPGASWQRALLVAAENRSCPWGTTYWRMRTAAVVLCTLHDLAAGVKLALAPVAAGVGLAAESPPHAVAAAVGRPRRPMTGRLGAVQVVAHRPIRRRKALPIDQQGTPN